MRPTSDLFSLIKHMTSGEKRHFKLLSSTYERDKNYLKLFEVVDKQEAEYDEAKIIVSLKNEKWIGHLYKIKNQLYNAILNGLAIYHRDADVRAQLSLNLDQIKILFEKKLYEQSKKLALRAKKTASKYEYYRELIRLLEWELKIIQQQLYVNTSRKEMEIISGELFSAIERMKSENEYTGVSMNFYIGINKSGTVRDSMEVEKYRDDFDLAVMKKITHAKSFHTEYLFYNLKATFSFYSNDFKTADHYREKIVELFKKNPHQIAENIDKYTGNLQNKAICLANLKKYDEVLVITQKLREVDVPSEKKMQEIYFESRGLELGTYLLTADFMRGLTIAKEFENNLGIIDEMLNKHLRIDVRLDIAKIYFCLNKFRQTNIWLNKITNDFKSDVRPDLLCITRIMQLVVYFEMRDNDLLEFSVKSTYRYLLKYKRLYKFEDAVLIFIRKKIPQIDTDKKMKKAFKEFKVVIEKIFVNPYEKKVLVYFDFISWLESKIEDRPIAEIIRKKARQVRA